MLINSHIPHSFWSRTQFFLDLSPFVPAIHRWSPCFPANTLSLFLKKDYLTLQVTWWPHIFRRLRWPIPSLCPLFHAANPHTNREPASFLPHVRPFPPGCLLRLGFLGVLFDQFRLSPIFSLRCNEWHFTPDSFPHPLVNFNVSVLREPLFTSPRPLLVRSLLTRPSF